MEAGFSSRRDVEEWMRSSFVVWVYTH